MGYLTTLGSILIPGLIVLATVRDFIYVPFAVEGFILINVAINSLALSLRFDAEKETLPTVE